MNQNIATPLDLDTEPDWMGYAACKANDPELFVSPFGPQALRQVKAVCSHCLVQANCLEYALASGDAVGIWGGLTQRERETLRQRRVF